MWQNISLNVTQVWDEALWRATAVWQDDEDSEPIVLQRTGRVSLNGDDSPELVLQAAVRDLQLTRATDWALR